MIVVAGHLSIDPAKRDDVLAAFTKGGSATREEAGNIDYRFSADLEDTERFNVTEIWESEDALTAHMAGPIMAGFMEAIGPCLTGADISRYDVSGSSKLF